VPLSVPTSSQIQATKYSTYLSSPSVRSARATRLVFKPAIKVFCFAFRSISQHPFCISLRDTWSAPHQGQILQTADHKQRLPQKGLLLQEQTPPQKQHCLRCECHNERTHRGPRKEGELATEVPLQEAESDKGQAQNSYQDSQRCQQLVVVGQCTQCEHNWN